MTLHGEATHVPNKAWRATAGQPCTHCGERCRPKDGLVGVLECRQCTLCTGCVDYHVDDPPGPGSLRPVAWLTRFNEILSRVDPERPFPAVDRSPEQDLRLDALDRRRQARMGLDPINEEPAE